MDALKPLRKSVQHPDSTICFQVERLFDATKHTLRSRLEEQSGENAEQVVELMNALDNLQVSHSHVGGIEGSMSEVILVIQIYYNFTDD